jgi:penicillin-binding protein 1A
LGEDALANGGYKIHTTILKAAQDAAEKTLAETLRKAEQHPGYVRQKHSEYRKGQTEGNPEYVQGAVFMVDHFNGEVIAHVGGRDYAEAPFDFIEQGKRPLGTAFFPFLYATALAGEHTPASMVEDQPMDNRSVMVGGREGILGEWGMEMRSPVYEGDITLRNAFKNSKIAATVRLGSEVGIQGIIGAGVIFGFPWEDSEALPRVSVGWESASLKQAVTAISTFPLGGKKGPTQFSYISSIKNSNGIEVFKKKPVENPSRRLLAEPVAWQIHDMMADGMDEGSARGLKEQLQGKPFHGAGKGGTTHDFSDAWFLGYSGRVSCGVWTGFLQGNSEPIYPGAFSRDLAMPVWVATMNAANPNFAGDKIDKPEELVAVQICSVSGQRVTQFCQELVADVATGRTNTVSTEMTDYFHKGNDSLPYCAVHSGSLSEAMTPTETFNSLRGSDALPVRPTDPVLLGDDPYHTELPSFAARDEDSRFNHQSTNVLDSFDLGKIEKTVRLSKPPRLEINPE